MLVVYHKIAVKQTTNTPQDPEVSMINCFPVIYPGDGKFYVTGSLKGKPVNIECDTLDEAVEAWKRIFKSHQHAMVSAADIANGIIHSDIQSMCDSVKRAAVR